MKHVNKIYQKSDKEINKIDKMKSDTNTRKKVDHLAIANLNSPLLKSKMMQFEQILISSDH